MQLHGLQVVIRPKLLLKGCVAHPDWYTWNSHLLRLHSAQGASAAVLLEHH